MMELSNSFTCFGPQKYVSPAALLQATEKENHHSQLHHHISAYCWKWLLRQLLVLFMRVWHLYKPLTP